MNRNNKTVARLPKIGRPHLGKIRGPRGVNLIKKKKVCFRASLRNLQKFVILATTGLGKMSFTANQNNTVRSDNNRSRLLVIKTRGHDLSVKINSSENLNSSKIRLLLHGLKKQSKTNLGMVNTISLNLEDRGRRPRGPPRGRPPPLITLSDHSKTDLRHRRPRLHREISSITVLALLLNLPIFQGKLLKRIHLHRQPICILSKTNIVSVSNGINLVDQQEPRRPPRPRAPRAWTPSTSITRRC